MSEWQEHDGSGVPEAIKRLPNDVRVLRRQRNGTEFDIPAMHSWRGIENLWLWGEHDGGFVYPADFVAYRILDQAAVPPVTAAPIDPNARMLENDQRGGETEAHAMLAVAASPGSSVRQETARPTYPGLLITADLDAMRFRWGA